MSTQPVSGAVSKVESTTLLDSNSRPKSFDQSTASKKNSKESPEAVFKEVKRKYAIATGAVGGGLSLISIIGALIKGPSFPARLLQVVGDGFGTIAALFAPFMQIKNEILNYRHFNREKNSNGNGNGESKIFDNHLKLFYRLCSQGLTPYIFERLINPENITKSIFHKIAAVINIPFTAFSGYTWGFGNTQAIIAWGLRQEENVLANKATTKEEKDYHLDRVDGYDKIYSSAERMLTIGSIANPVMPCLQYCADGLDYIVKLFKGEASTKEFFERPCLWISKLVSTVIALPEAYAKGIDALMRVLVSERKHLRAVLPKSLSSLMYKVGDKLNNELSKPDNNFLKRTKNSAEMIFHTLSPFAMAALFSPMIDRKNINEEAQTRGGTTAFLDTWIGRYAKLLSLVFTGFYVTFGRLPQGILQSIYFGRKLYGNHIKHEDEITTQKELIALREKIYNNKIVAFISDLAKKGIENIVPNFYKIEHEYGFPNYKQVLAKYSFDQAKEEYKYLFENILGLFTKDEKSRIQAIGTLLKDELVFKKASDYYQEQIKLNLNEILNEIISDPDSAKEKIMETIVTYCSDYSSKECLQGNYPISPSELSEIETLIRNKVNHITTAHHDREKEHLSLRFPGALFFARNFLAPLDLRSRLVNWGHDKLLKLEVYECDEKNRAFNNELEVVGAENADCARRFVNWVQGIPAYSN